MQVRVLLGPGRISALLEHERLMCEYLKKRQESIKHFKEKGRTDFKCKACESFYMPKSCDMECKTTMRFPGDGLCEECHMELKHGKIVS